MAGTPFPPPPVGREEPLPPAHSLPSYHEPTPETHRRLSREEEAELALKRTEFSPGIPALLISLFLLTIVSVPTMQTAFELRTRRAGERIPMFDVLKALPSLEKIRNV